MSLLSGEQQISYWFLLVVLAFYVTSKGEEALEIWSSWDLFVPEMSHPVVRVLSLKFRDYDVMELIITHLWMITLISLSFILAVPSWNADYYTSDFQEQNVFEW